MTLKIENHKLTGSNTQFKATTKTSGPFATDLPDTIVIHYTAGASAESSVRTLINPAIKASAHLVLGRAGEIIQLAPFNIITWHAGTSAHLNRSGLNKYSIGIEIDNAGPLKMENGKLLTWFNREIDPADAVKATHRNQSAAKYWHRYTEQQISSVTEICQLLIEEYGIKYIVGHEEISPTRKTDPGPAFPLDDMRNRLLADRSDDTGVIGSAGTIATDFLNIRSGAGASNSKVAQPLRSGAEIKVVDESNGWYKVETTITGWVSKNHVALK